MRLNEEFRVKLCFGRELRTILLSSQPFNPPGKVSLGEVRQAETRATWNVFTASNTFSRIVITILSTFTSLLAGVTISYVHIQKEEKEKDGICRV